MKTVTNPKAAALGKALGEMHKLADQGLPLQAEAKMHLVFQLLDEVREAGGLPPLPLSEGKRMRNDFLAQIAGRVRDAKHAV